MQIARLSPRLFAVLILAGVMALASCDMMGSPSAGMNTASGPNADTGESGSSY